MAAFPQQLRCDHGSPAAGRDLPYAWQRDTMIIDLRGLAGDGDCVLRPAAAAGWPERIALRVTPGSTPALEVLADQRLRWPATAAAGGNAVDLVLPHALHSPATPEIRLRWGSAAGVAAAESTPVVQAPWSEQSQTAVPPMQSSVALLRRGALASVWR